jgi:pimeloyl-ACP methyl ester carboxylesterase
MPTTARRSLRIVATMSMPRPLPPPQLLLLPGLLCDAALWLPQIEALADCCEATVMDLTGQDSIVEMADAVLARAPSAFALAGFSMGGQVALEIQARAPQRVQRLALMSTNDAGLVPAVREHLGHAIERIDREGLSGYLNDAFPLYFGHCGDAGGTLRTVFFRMAERLGPAVAIRQLRALLGYRGRDRGLEAIMCPTLLLCGAVDARTPVALHEEMAARISHAPHGHASLSVIADSGHFTLLEKPAEVATALRAWLHWPSRR